MVKRKETPAEAPKASAGVQNTAVPRTARKFSGIVVGLGLVAMLGAALAYFAEHPGLTVHSTGGSGMAASSGTSGMSGTAPEGMSEAQQSALMALMQKLQANPQDVEALMSLAGHFLHTEDYPRSENFAMRAVMATQGADTAMPLYMLSMAQHSQGRHKEAADSLERSLAAREDAETRYSLGILYRYFLNDDARGLEELKKALSAPGINESLKKQLEAEITKAPPKK